MMLPKTNESGYFEIRLESIGGLGANLLGKMLGELGAIQLGLNAASFSSYGSEKRGSPVQAYVRWSEREIRENSPVIQPHILGLFHERMATDQKILSGVQADGCIVVNSERSGQEMTGILGTRGVRVFCVDAQKIAMESKTRINMVMLGAIVRASGFVPLSAAEKLVRETVGKKYPQLLEANIIGLRRGFDECASAKAEGEFEQVEQPYQMQRWGYATAPLGGVNPCIGNTVQNDLSASREGYLPLFFPEKCIHCGLCDSTCPDLVFQFVEGERDGKKSMLNKGLDYTHCKGCLRCVAVCPTHALEAGVEREHPNPKHRMQNRDLVTDDIAFRVRGADASVTGEAYLDEKRVDGGMV